MEALSSPSSRVSIDSDRLQTKSAWRSRFRLMLVHDGYWHIDQAISQLQSRSFPSDSEVLLLSVSDLFRAPLHLAGKEVESAPGHSRPTRRLPKHKKTQAFFDKLESIERLTCDKLQAAFPGWEIRFDRPCAWHPDAIFLGAFDPLAARHAGFAEIIRKLSAESSVPLIIARGQTERRTPRRFSVVVFDGPASAAALLKELQRRPAKEGSELYLIFYKDPLMSPAERWSAGYEEPDHGWVGTQLVKTRKAIEALGHKVSCVNVVGNTARAILQEAKRVGADSILLGTAPLQAIGSLGLQSIAAAVAAQADCSVEIVFSEQKLQPTATLRAMTTSAKLAPWKEGGDARPGTPAPM